MKIAALYEQDILTRLAQPGAELVLKRLGSEWFAADVFFPGMDPEAESEVNIPAARRLIKRGEVVSVLALDVGVYVSRIGQKSACRHNYTLKKTRETEL